MINPISGQLCAHALLIQGPICDLLEREDFEKLNSITESEDEMTEEGAALLIHLRNVLRTNVGVKTVEGGIGSGVVTENESLATDVINIDNVQGETGGKHGLSFRFRKYLSDLRNSESWEAIGDCMLWMPSATQRPTDHELLPHLLPQLLARPSTFCGETWT